MASSALDAELVKVPDDDSDLEVDLAHGDGGQPVPVRRRAHQVGVPQLVAAADVVLRDRVAEPSRCRPPDGDIGIRENVLLSAKLSTKGCVNSRPRPEGARIRSSRNLLRRNIHSRLLAR